MITRKKLFARFLAFFFGTIVPVRGWVLIVQEKSLFLFGSEIHHFYIGAIIVILSGFARFFSQNKRYNLFNLELFAIGAGLIIDEILFLIFTSGAHSAYFSFFSTIGTLITATVLSMIFYFIYWFEKKREKNE